MRPIRFDGHRPDSYAGSALVIVLAMLVLISALALAFFTTTATERTAAKSYSDSGAVRNLANSALQLVMAQVSDATTGAKTDASGIVDPSQPLAWASQPGMIRTYDTSGNPYRYYKLYSGANRIVSDVTAYNLTADIPPADWRSNPSTWTDLNAPVTDSTGTLNYPILDPVALTSGTQGFSVTNAPGYDSSGQASATNNPAPMPVSWLYQLKDGTFVSSTNSGSTTTIPGASKDNPIIGRVAFWSDDETCKINVNTAAGDEWAPAQISTTSDINGNQSYTPPGAFWDTPRCSNYFEHDNLGKYQPAQGEFQRFPGHPATVYLSAVFPTLARANLFDMVPRLNGGGSLGGTQVATGAVSPKANRMYASVDELQFSNAPSSPTRSDSRLNTSSTLSKGVLEGAKFFLTANSRAPEVNLFNKPRIAIWPIDQDVVTKAAAGTQSPRGTAFDNLIGFCAHLGPSGNGNDYFFQRGAGGSTSLTQDAAIPRNIALIAYLEGLAGQPIPGYGGSLSGKFGADTQQIFTEVFDYVRNVNLSDDNIAYKGVSNSATFVGVPFGGANAYTLPYQVAASPAGGQTIYQGFPQTGTAWVAPTRIADTQAFGRFATVSETGVLVICTADGKSTSTNPLWSGTPTKGDGGLTASNSAGTVFYSNFPPLKLPLPTAAQVAAHPFFKTAPGYSDLSKPGLQAANWNYTLQTYDWAADPTGLAWTGLASGEKRVQAMLVIEPFCVAEGKKDPGADFQIRVQGLDTLTINGTNLGFPADGNLKYRDVQPATATDSGLGHTGLLGWRTFLTGDSAWGSNILNGPQAPSDAGYNSASMCAYPFVSQPVTVSGSRMTFSAPASSPVNLSIHYNAELGSPNPPTTPAIQVIAIDFSQLNSPLWPLPDLIIATAFTNYTGGGPACFWRLSQAGALQSAPVSKNTAGRFYALRNSAANSSYYTTGLIQKNSGDLTGPGDVIRTLVPGYPGAGGTGPVRGDYRVLAAMQSVPSTVFVPHSSAALQVNKRAHSFSDPSGYVGTSNADANINGRLVPISNMGAYGALKTPSGTTDPRSDAQLLPSVNGDFDNGIGPCFDGPFINKPDEGDQFSQNVSGVNNDYLNYPYFGGSSYFQAGYLPGFFSPNRQIPSAGMFGSLPTGVKRGLPWQTLLFRPQPQHPSGVPVPDSTTGSSVGPPYGSKVADHILMDLFWMPVVDPYAISEPFSTAGKINLNYQIAPFTYIKRPTALIALLRSQRILAIANTNSAKYKTPWVGGAMKQGDDMDYRADLNLSSSDGTLRQFEQKFTAGDIFRSASQICDIYLTPQGQSWNTNAQAESFWKANQLTGDNSRERPYANLYACLTTKSNTFTVHIRAQTLQKVPGTPSDQWVEGRDRVAAEERSSSIIERYIDVEDSNLPDFAVTASTALSDHYRIRVISTKRFTP